MTTANSQASAPVSVTTAPLTTGLAGVKNVVLVLSGKGGVGKSSCSTQLAVSLATSAARPTVGVLDIDLCGPSIPRMLGVDDAGAHVLTSSQGWVPYAVPGTGGRLKVMSIGLLMTNKDDAVVWRGPKKSAMIQQFIADVCWGDLDYLVIDTPPGTSDEHLAIMEALRGYESKSAVIVTTPQAVAISDVRKEINFCQKVKLPMLGVVENMSGFRCPHCADCTDIFASGGGAKLAEQFQLRFLGALPIDPAFAQMVDSAPTQTVPVGEDGTTRPGNLADVYPASAMAKDFAQVRDGVLAALAAKAAAAAAAGQ
ncbi:cytosolic Fe-S cluster assembly factor cfd1 [Blastocladiella emersonii ATCC 22665]|nr:cytosolic Fe-S cluster assembly factor cfd1 [Blastocladiella emersonii ATCC 22665]